MKSLQWPRTREIARLKYSRMLVCVCLPIVRNDAPRLGNKRSGRREEKEALFIERVHLSQHSSLSFYRRDTLYFNAGVIRAARRS